MRSSRRRSEHSSDVSRDHRRTPKLQLESLEPRAMMSATPLTTNVTAQPNISFFAGSAMNVYSPAQIRHAYGFDQLSLNGAGQTIAIVDAYDDPTIAADLHKFDQQFGLADPKLTVDKLASGGHSPTYNSGWAMEIALDVEWAHAIAPGANIILVEAASSSLSDLLGAVNFARNQAGVSVVSMSWGAGEFNGEGTYDSYFTTPAGHTGVTFVASAGDSGAPASWPSISSNVLAVGGTTLTLSSNGSYGSEKGWSGSGGGYSPYETEPTFQRGFQNTGHRSNPDVSYDADPFSGFYVYDSAAGGSWYAVGGTSAGAPQWAGLIAIANQGRAAAGRAPLSTALQAIYSLGNGDFHDVTTGSNGYAAGVGYDPVTGRGSPIANFVVRDLVNYGAVTTTAPVKTTAPTTFVGPPTSGKMQKAADVADGVQTAIDPTVGEATAVFGGNSSQVDGSASTYGTVETNALSSTPLTASFISNHTADTSGGDSLTVDSSEAGGEISLAAKQLSPAERIDALPEAAFETSADSANDPLGALDRVERLIHRYLESGAAIDNSVDPAHIDACLADPVGITLDDQGDSILPTTTESADSTATTPAAAAFGLMIAGGWGRDAVRDEADKKLHN